MIVIKVINLDKQFSVGGKQVMALKQVNLDIKRKEFVALFGSSGAGKSTLLHLLGGLDTPTKGRIRILGQDIQDLPAGARNEFRKKNIGFVFQSFHLLSHLSARENVELPLLFSGCPARKRREKSEHLLRRMGLSGRMDHKPRELSGGQRQRVSLARAVIDEPSVLLADEPTGNLDRSSGRRVVRIMEGLRNTGPTSIVLATHDEQLLGYADRVLRMEDGHLVDGGRDAGPGDRL